MLPTGSRLVQKHAGLSAVSTDQGQIMFSSQTKRTWICFQVYWDHLFNQVSGRLFGPLLVRAQVQLLHSHLHKQTAPNGENALKFDSIELRLVWKRSETMIALQK